MATLTCCEIHHMGAKLPHLLKPKSYISLKSTDLLIREDQVVAFRYNLAPLTQPLGALPKGEHENDLKGKERKE